MSKATKFRKIRDGMTAAVAALGATSLIAGVMVLGTAGAAQADQGKVWVCKYVGDRGSEDLAPGKNPIRVSSDKQPGDWFNDAQGPSYVLEIATAANTGNGNKYTGSSLCPGATSATAVAPSVTQSPECRVQGSYTIPSTEGVRYLLGGVEIAAGTYEGPASGTITAEALEGYQLTNPEFSFGLDVKAAEKCEPTSATAVAPSVKQSPKCEQEGSYTIPSTAGVRYLLGGVEIAAGTYEGPASGTITAEALEGYQLTNSSFSFDLDVKTAEKCDGDATPATAVAPSVKQSPKCEQEGSYTIPSTAGVRYLLGGVEIAADTYSGPASGTITAEALPGYVLTDSSFSFALKIAAAEECDDTTPPPTPSPTTPPPTPPTTPPVVPSPPAVTPPAVTPPVVTPPTTDVCSNIPGAQGSVPLGYTAVDGVCTKDGVAGEETEEPEPTQPAKTDKPKGQKPAAAPDEVLGEEAVPTAVAAGVGGPTGSVGSTSSLLGQALVAGGLMMVLLAGSAQMGRRQRGAHER